LILLALSLIARGYLDKKNMRLTLSANDQLSSLFLQKNAIIINKLLS